nr:Chain A, Lactoferrin [Sus scrofa]
SKCRQWQSKIRRTNPIFCIRRASPT